MDESQIAGSLLQNVQNTQDEPVTPTPIEGDPGYPNKIPDFNAYRMMDYFGVNPQYRKNEVGLG